MKKTVQKSYANKSDSQLITLFRQGHEDVMDFIMVKYKSLVRAKAKSMFILGGDSEDLIQEGMIGLMKAVRDYSEDQGTSFSTFANLCVSRQIYTAIERAGRQKHIPLNQYISLYDEEESGDQEKKPPLIETIESESESNPETLYFGKEFTQDFIKRLQERLSPLEIDVLSLHILGNDYRTIGEILEKPPKTIDNAIQRSKQKAIRLLKEDE